MGYLRPGVAVVSAIGQAFDRTLSNFVYRIPINTSISFTRKRAARGGRALQLNPAELTRHIEERQTHDGHHGDSLARLYEAIAQLGAVERALIALFLEDLSYEQIAEVLGVSANHVGVMLHRAKKKLSALMTPNDMLMPTASPSGFSLLIPCFCANINIDGKLSI
jgi:RNA polymerase sigma factor (sigma-70 family)